MKYLTIEEKDTFKKVVEELIELANTTAEMCDTNAIDELGGSASFFQCGKKKFKITIEEM